MIPKGLCHFKKVQAERGAALWGGRAGRGAAPGTGLTVAARAS